MVRIEHIGIAVKELDKANELFTIPDYVSKMVEKGWLGSKSKQGKRARN